MAIEISNEGARRKPALPILRACAAQCLSLCVVLPFALIFPLVSGIDLPLLALLLMQGVLAALLSRLFKLAPWWLPMQIVLPLALPFAWSWHLPSFVYLAAFLFCLALYGTTFRTQVPYYPSGPAAWSAVAALLPPERALRVVDIGSGFGGLVLHLARQRSESAIMGIEVAPLPWLVSRLRAALAGSGAVFAHGDYNRLDFGDFDVVFAYLSPAAMPALWEKARAEMRPGALLLSYEFVIPGVQSQITNICGSGNAILYGWQI